MPSADAPREPLPVTGDAERPLPTARRDEVCRSLTPNYNSASGALIYDFNGNAAGGAVQFGALSKNLALTPRGLPDHLILEASIAKQATRLEEKKNTARLSSLSCVECSHDRISWQYGHGCVPDAALHRRCS